MMGCGYCDWWEQVSEFNGICTHPDNRNYGEYVGSSDNCGKWAKKSAPIKAEPVETKAEYVPGPENLDPSFLIQFVRQNSCFDADLLANIIEEWKQFKKLVPCGECKHYHEETGYCELNSYFVDNEGLCCSPAESPSWTMWDKSEFCSRGERKDDGNT